MNILIHEKSVAAFLQQHLSSLDQSQMMGFVFLSNIREELGREDVDYDDLAKAAAEVTSNTFNVTPRQPDDFSDEPYLWITPRPKPVKLVGRTRSY